MLKIVLSFLPATCLLALLFLSGCMDKDEPGCGELRTQTYKLSEADKAQIPYTGFDTVRMTNNAGDTIECIGTGKQYFVTSEYIPEINPDCAGRGGTQKNYEAYKLSFIDNHSSLNIKHYKESFPLDGKYYNMIISFKNNNFYTADYAISYPSAFNFIGNIELNNTLFEDVNRLYKNFNDTSSYILINKKNGILKISQNGTEVWQLTN
ncbi:MAG: hypothetical protein V4590_01630 [Bacteroidota bacterium]